MARTVKMTETQLADMLTYEALRKAESTPEGRQAIAAMPTSAWNRALDAERREIERRDWCRRNNAVHGD